MTGIFTTYAHALASGLLVTLQLATIIWTTGVTFGAPLGALLGISRRSVSATFRHCSYAVSSVPAIVALFWVHYPLQTLLGIALDPFITAACVLSAYNIITVSGLVAGSVRKFPREYLDAARIVGLSGAPAIRHVMVPIVLRQLLPPLLVSQIAALHTTIFASLISVPELFRTAQQINAVEYRPVQVFTVLAMFYLTAGFPVFVVAEYLEFKYQRDLSEH